MIPHTHVSQAEFDPAKALRAVAGLGVAGIGILGAHLLGFGLRCPLLSLTGIQCPFCGSTRAAASILRGDLAAAWSYNAWIMVVGMILAVCVIAWSVELLGGPKIRPSKWVGDITQNKIYWLAGITGVAFMAIRNLV